MRMHGVRAVPRIVGASWPEDTSASPPRTAFLMSARESPMDRRERPADGRRVFDVGTRVATFASSEQRCSFSRSYMEPERSPRASWGSPRNARYTIAKGSCTSGRSYHRSACRAPTPNANGHREQARRHQHHRSGLRDRCEEEGLGPSIEGAIADDLPAVVDRLCAAERPAVAVNEAIVEVKRRVAIPEQCT